MCRYREAGAEVINVLTQFSKRVERASIDEAYIDLTEEVKDRLHKMRNDGVKVKLDELPCTFVVGWDGKEKEKDEENGGTAEREETKISEEGKLESEQVYSKTLCHINYNACNCVLQRSTLARHQLLQPRCVSRVVVCKSMCLGLTMV